MNQPTPPPAVSSSSTLWATPSKEWVIPAKPKPGRKPKKEPPPPAEMDPEVDAKGRRVQNRAAQRAFRERKQSQLADLQARVQQYEQGEIERNVALQNIAKRLKEENEKLQRENAFLRERLAKTEGERDALRDISRKRWRDDSRPPSPLNALDHPAKKTKVSSEATTSTQESSLAISYMSSPSSMSSPESPAHSSFSPAPTLPPLRDGPVIAQGNGSNTLGNIFDLISTGKTNMFEPGGSMDTFDCGFCNENTPCVCRELAIQQVADRLTTPVLKVETFDHNASILPLDPGAQQPSATSATTPVTPSSILDNLPAYQPPVPLRRRINASDHSVFPVTPASLQAQHSSSTSLKVASCSGDPSNCMACADDTFGKAFCAAINKSAVASPPCEQCPTRWAAPSNRASDGCCRKPALCQNHAEKGLSSQPVRLDEPIPTSNTTAAASASSGTPTQTIPCNDAWKQIKSHPNASFADLSLLAEVVARRSKCTGPRVEISPAPGSITPERGISPSFLSADLPSARMDTNGPSVQLSNPHTIYRETLPAEVSPDMESLGVVSCGRSRIREVQADGVRDALRLLDLKYSAP